MMMALPGGALDWVTVVEVANPGTPQCAVTYLEYGTQTTLPFATFDSYWSLSISLTWVAVDVAGIVSPYTTSAVLRRLRWSSTSRRAARISGPTIRSVVIGRGLPRKPPC